MPSGNAGVDLTVDSMARMSQGQFGSGSPRIIALARQIIADAQVPEKDQDGEVDAIHAWVQAHMRYVKDPMWYEFVTYPETLAFDTPTGDCDDFCVLESALLGAIGIPTRFVVFGFGTAPAPSHVALSANVGGSWIPLDPIVKSKPPGWEVPDYTLRHAYGVNTPTGYARNTYAKLAGVAALAVGIWGMYSWLHTTAKRLEK